MTTLESRAPIAADAGRATVPSMPITGAQPQGQRDLAEEVAQLREALATRTLIGQATGIVAARLQLTTDTAWQVVRRASTDRNVKVRRIAAVIVASHDKTLPAEDVPIAHAIAPILGFSLDTT